MPEVTMISRQGNAVPVPEEQVQAALAQGFTLESSEQQSARLTQERREDQYGGIKGKIAAGVAGVFRGASLGLTDAFYRAVGAHDEIREYRDINPGASFAGELLGGLATGRPGAAGLTPAGAAANLGARIARSAEGAGAAAQVGRAAAGYAAEGAIVGLGQGVSEVALSRKPIDAEEVASVLSSRALLGGAIGGAAGSLGKLAEVGLSKARGVVEEAAAKAEARASAVTDDLAGLDTKGLRAAEKAELEAIEAARVPQRNQLVDELAASSKATREEKVWLATEGLKDAEFRVIRKQSLNSTKLLERALDNPKYLADNPGAALAALQKQEHSLEQLAAKADELRASWAKAPAGEGAEAVTASSRAAALDKLPAALERNRALQAKIRELTGAPSSGRLSAIEDARAALQAPAPPKTLGEQVAGGMAFSTAAGLASAIPLIGPIAAPFLGAKAASFVSDKVFGRVGKAVSEAQVRGAKALAAFLGKAERGVAGARPLSTRTLQGAAFALTSPPEAASSSSSSSSSGRPGRRAHQELIAAYRARSAELRSQVAAGPDGRLVMHQGAREQLAERLKPIASLDPRLADGIESIVARKVAYLAATLPRVHELPGMQTGPDRRHPPDTAMRSWAKRVAAAEDPWHVLEQLGRGKVSPEAAETVRAVYPELHAAAVALIVEQLGSLTKRLPRRQRFALSVFTGEAIDPVFDPGILRVLQAQYEPAPAPSSPGPSSSSGPRRPLSNSAEVGTPAQQRELGAAA